MNRENIVLGLVNKLLESKERIIVAIDGRCASGKTTLAQNIAKLCDCNVFHMDDFFLRPEQRTEERLSQAGENIDHERFLTEVLCPLRNGESFEYRPFSCKSGKLGPPISAVPKRINIVEGSYSLNKNLTDYYDLKLFLSVDPKEQMRRILEREGKEKAEAFSQKWIPLEEKYFKAYDLMNNCDNVL